METIKHFYNDLKRFSNSDILLMAKYEGLQADSLDDTRWMLAIKHSIQRGEMTEADMFNEIVKHLPDTDQNLGKIADPNELKILYDLYVNNDTNFKDESLSPEGLNYVGAYYNNKDYEKAKEYFRKAIKDGNVYAMYNLGLFYFKHSARMNDAEHYLRMAAERGNVDALFQLGLYHQEVTRNYDEMERYYKMAIEKGDPEAMYNLGYYHQYTTRNYDEMEKYYQMAIKNNYKKVRRPYYNYLISLKPRDIINYRIDCTEKTAKIKALEDEVEHLTYRPGGPGMEEAREEYNRLLAKREPNALRKSALL